MKNYVVKKGRHYCWHGQKLHWDKDELILSFIIDPSSSYNLDNLADQTDINKIGGITFGLGSIKLNSKGIVTAGAIHKNSIRIGMYDDGGIVRIYVYWYNKNKRYSQYINTSIYGLFCSYGFRLDRINNVIKVNNRLGPEAFTIDFDFTDVPNWGFYCYPFFGGTSSSPVNWKIQLNMT